MGLALTILVLAANAPVANDDALTEIARVRGATITAVTTSTLGARVVPALAVGAVVLIVRTDADASYGLGLGVDEVVRAGEWKRAQLDAAIDRAVARAAARIGVSPHASADREGAA